GARRAALDGIGRRRLRQRHGRELLRHARMRADRSAALPQSGRGGAGGVRMDRGLVQLPSPPLVARLPLAERVRAAACGGGSGGSGRVEIVALGATWRAGLELPEAERRRGREVIARGEQGGTRGGGGRAPPRPACRRF